MARTAKPFTAEFVQTFEAKFFEMFPSVKTDKELTRKQVVSTMRVLGTDEYPMWLLQEKNRKDRGVYKLAEYVAPAPKAPKVAKNKATKGISSGPSVNSQRWASGKAPLKQVKVVKAVKGDYNPGAFDDTVTYDDVASLRSEFGLGEYRNTLD
jgi:hypothetical protein